MAASSSRREAAFLAFSAEFDRNGFGNAPEGLVHLLRTFAPKKGEQADATRSRLYKRLWQILWFGNKVGAESHERPTYVYPATLKAVIREVIPGDMKAHVDPSGPRVYKVNIGNLATAKWPPIKRKN